MNAFGHLLKFNTHTEWFIEHHQGDLVALRSWAGYALRLMPRRASFGNLSPISLLPRRT